MCKKSKGFYSTFCGWVSNQSVQRKSGLLGFCPALHQELLTSSLLSAASRTWAGPNLVPACTLLCQLPGLLLLFPSAHLEVHPQPRYYFLAELMPVFLLESTRGSSKLSVVFSHFRRSLLAVSIKNRACKCTLVNCVPSNKTFPSFEVLTIVGQKKAIAVPSTEV